MWMGWSRSYGGTVSQPTDALRLLALAWDQGGETQQLALVNRLFKVRFFLDFIRSVGFSKGVRFGPELPLVCCDRDTLSKRRIWETMRSSSSRQWMPTSSRPKPRCVSHVSMSSKVPLVDQISFSALSFLVAILIGTGREVSCFGRVQVGGSAGVQASVVPRHQRRSVHGHRRKVRG